MRKISNMKELNYANLQQTTKSDLCRGILDIALQQEQGLTILFKTKSEADYIKRHLNIVKSHERKRNASLSKDDPLYRKSVWDNLVAKLEPKDPNKPNGETYLTILDGLIHMEKIFTFVDTTTKEEKTLDEILCPTWHWISQK